MTKNSANDVEKKILRPLWKVRILHHADKEPIIGNWMLDKLCEHGYRVSPGTFYPMLARIVLLGWLDAKSGKAGTAHGTPSRKKGALH